MLPGRVFVFSGSNRDTHSHSCRVHAPLYPGFAVIGYYLGMLSPLMLAISLSFASGAMLYVVLGELLPEAILMWRSKVPAFSTLIGIIVGLIIIFH